MVRALALALPGLTANPLCRNIGVLQTTVAELVTDVKHQRTSVSLAGQGTCR